MKITGRNSRRDRLQLVLIILGLAGIPGFFLPFAYGVSPACTVVCDIPIWFGGSSRDFWFAGLPMFLVLLVPPASFRWLTSRKFTALEKSLAYITAISMAGVSLYVWVEAFSAGAPGPRSWAEWVSSGIQPLILVLGIAALLRLSKRPSASRACPVIAMQIVYVAHMALWLTGFYGDWEIGAYLLLVAAITYAIQIILFLVPESDASKAVDPEPR